MAKKSGSLMGGGCGVVKKEAGYCIANGSKGGNNPTTRGQTGRKKLGDGVSFRFKLPRRGMYPQCELD